MLAGLSFFSRFIKYACEKCKILDASYENYVELKEENNKKEKLDQGTGFGSNIANKPSEGVNENNQNVNIQLPDMNSKDTKSADIDNNNCTSKNPLQ